MPDDATMLLVGAWQKPRYVDKSEQRNAVRVARAHEAGRFDGGINVKAPSELLRLIGDDANGASAHPAKARDDVLRIVGLELKERALVEHALYERLRSDGMSPCRSGSRQGRARTPGVWEQGSTPVAVCSRHVREAPRARTTMS